MMPGRGRQPAAHAVAQGLRQGQHHVDARRRVDDEDRGREQRQRVRAEHRDARLRAARPPSPSLRRRRCTAPRRRASCPRLRSAPSRVTTMRAPLAPIGWPSATAPPCTLTISCGSLNSVIAAIVTAAKASFTSQRSTSSALPAGLLQHLLDRADRRGGEPGSAPAHAPQWATIRAIGFEPSRARGRFAHQHQRGGAVGDARRGGGGDRAVLLERRLQARDLVELGLERLLVELDHGVAALAGHA